jgi:predicted Zn finger-like uncharacterized protein
MVVSCASCGKKYKVTDDHFKGRDRIAIKCPNCGHSIEAHREGAAPPPAPLPAPPPAPPPTAVHRADDTGSALGGPESEGLAMPEGKRVSLAILQGSDAGTIYPIEKTVVVIGRSEADLVLNDTEVSRRHAQIELKSGAVILRDLKSTNGTYINEQRISMQPLENQAEFRVGATTIMVILTEIES